MPLTIFEAMMAAISLSTFIVSVLAWSFTFITLQIVFEAIRLIYLYTSSIKIIT
ncbi:hypothetical protein I6G82_10260 [Lysinibacillus macroides]|uniref:hypothetical protein n=1 Tax=Lysinibacillus macroides TaxID=33935 RepID=UPI001379214E|nr:hypothetical protein [Lysinibacillus macroides]QPR69921.1 hypothetical protein I6G82_10260 [Lysinibacillus macroides]